MDSYGPAVVEPFDTVIGLTLADFLLKFLIATFDFLLRSLTETLFLIGEKQEQLPLKNSINAWLNNSEELIQSFVTQLIGVCAIAGFTFIMSYLTTLAINTVMPIRATDEEQDMGLDVSEIGIEAYPEFK